MLASCAGIREPAAAARLFAAEGVRALIAALEEDEGQALADSLGDGCRFLRLDVTVEDDVRRAVELAVATWGRLDSLCNNAGFGGALGPVAETTADDYDITMAVLAKSVFSASSMPRLRQHRRHRRHGSRLGAPPRTALPRRPSSRSPAPPPWNRPERHLPRRDGYAAQRLRRRRGEGAAGRVGEPEGIASLALRLASDESAFATGQAVDGDLTAGRPWREQSNWLRRHRPPGR